MRQRLTAPLRKRKGKKRGEGVFHEEGGTSVSIVQAFLHKRSVFQEKKGERGRALSDPDRGKGGCRLRPCGEVSHSVVTLYSGCTKGGGKKKQTLHSSRDDEKAVDGREIFPEKVAQTGGGEGKRDLGSDPEGFCAKRKKGKHCFMNESPVHSQGKKGQDYSQRKKKRGLSLVNSLHDRGDPSRRSSAYMVTPEKFYMVIIENCSLIWTEYRKKREKEDSSSLA